MSWPDPAWASAASVSRFLLPTEVMKSIETSVLFFSAHDLTSLVITSFAPGTQWSQKPMVSLPAAAAVRICTSGNAAVAAPTFNALRRDSPVFIDRSPPSCSGAVLCPSHGTALHGAHPPRNAPGPSGQAETDEARHQQSDRARFRRIDRGQ